MNTKILAILSLCMATFVCAQSSPLVGTPAPREHRGFYSSTSFSFAYNWYDASEYDGKSFGSEKYRDMEYFEYNGFTYPMMEFKFGVALGNLVALYSVFNLGFYIGAMDYRYEEYKEVCDEDDICVPILEEDEMEEFSSADAYSFRSFVGFGTTVYPFRDKKSPLNGLFVSSAIGYTLFVTVINSNDENAYGNGGIGYEMEIGKEWWINDHMAIGVGLGFAHSSLVWHTVDSHKSDNVLSLSFRITRG